MHPRDAVRRIPKVGGTKSVKLEAVRALKPTHVILNRDENRKETADALAEFVPHLVVTHPLGPLDNLALFRQFGAEFDRAREAKALCARFEQAYAAVSATAFPARNVLYLIWKDPWMTVSPDTYISRTLALVGLRTLPAAAQERYPRLSDLRVQGVDAVLLSTEPYRFDERHREEVEALTGRPAYLVDGEMTSWYGPRAINGLGYLKDFAARVAGVS